MEDYEHLNSISDFENFCNNICYEIECGNELLDEFLNSDEANEIFKERYFKKDSNTENMSLKDFYKSCAYDLKQKFLEVKNIKRNGTF